MTIPSLLFAPPVPVWLLAVAGLLAVLFVLYGWIQGGAKRMAWHLLPALAILATLANPRLAEEESTSLDDVALVVVDESPSMGVAQRGQQAERALAAVTERLAKLPHLQVRVVRHRNPPGRDEGTRLFSTLDGALADVPRQRLAGVVLITDGEVADVPAKSDLGTPLHVLLAGHRAERDRRVVVERAPSFGLVGSVASVTVKVEDPGQGGTVGLSLRKDGGEIHRIEIPLNTSQRIDVPIDHAGSNVVEIETEAAPDELTLANNRTGLAITGVRDRLRVLMISGEPHAGERTWRNLLKADPSVDLVHFTILRPPEKDDRTPLRELALIAFPVKELFEQRLHDFDLVIFDRYQRRAVLPAAYYQNIADYVKGGGALLMSVGPEFARANSPYDTALSQILPASPTGDVIERAFRPAVTAAGKRHPVTAELPGGEPPQWGPWLRQIGSTLKSSTAQVAMEGPSGQPLLVLDHVGKGRVAEMLSDTAWLWGRGWQGGGPQAELLRRLAHWLMKEPELEEESLTAEIRAGRLDVTRRSLSAASSSVTVRAPDGSTRQLPLSDRGDGRATGSLDADEQGLWRVEDGERVALAAQGALDPVEMAELRATPDKLKPLADATGGGIAWIDDGVPEMRRVAPKAGASGQSWFGFRANGERMVTSVTEVPLIPPAVLLLLAFGGLILAWWREGR